MPEMSIMRARFEAMAMVRWASGMHAKVDASTHFL
jgi:hypothetical protein